MLAEVDIGPLHADGAACVDDDKSHLCNTAHAAHWLTRLGQEIKLAGDRELRIEQHWQTHSRHLLELPRIRWCITVDDIDIRFLAERLDRLLQLTELLNTKLSGDPHVRDQHQRPALARCDRVPFPIRVRECEGRRRLPDERIHILSALWTAQWSW